MPKNMGLQQAYELRNAAASEALGLIHLPPPKNPRTRTARAMAFCSLSKAWELASDRIRILRGQPLPGSRKPEQRKGSDKRKWTDIPPDKA